MGGKLSLCLELDFTVPEDLQRIYYFPADVRSVMMSFPSAWILTPVYVPLYAGNAFRSFPLQGPSAVKNAAAAFPLNSL